MATRTAILRRYVRELNRRNYAVLAAVVAESVVMWGEAGESEVVSRGEYRRRIEDRVAAAPDYRVVVREVVEDGEWVRLSWERTFTDGGGSPVREALVSRYRVWGGRIVEVAAG